MLHAKPKKKILVIDDETMVREVIAEHLKMENFDVDLAANSSQALDLFQKTRYDLITIDLRMPQMDGSKLHFVLSKGFGYGQRVSDLIPQRLPPVLVITGNAKDNAIQGLLAGENVAGILEKPVRHDELIEAVLSILSACDLRRTSHEKVLKFLGSRVRSRQVARPSAIRDGPFGMDSE